MERSRLETYFKGSHLREGSGGGALDVTRRTQEEGTSAGPAVSLAGTWRAGRVNRIYYKMICRSI